MSQREELNKSWQNQWEEGKAGWHTNEVNPHLKEYISRFDGDLRGKRILVPLCGKSVDLKWLYEKGMSVIGIDVVELAVKGFFEENGLKHEVDDLKNGCKIYRHDDRLCIYLCDVFTLDVKLIGKCDYLWDRGALVAMVYGEQKKYCEVIDSLLSENAQGLIESFEYDRSLHPGPPHDVSKENVLEMFGDKYHAEKLCHRTNDELVEGYAIPFPFDQVRTMLYIKRKL